MTTGTLKVGRLIFGGPAPPHRITIWRGRGKGEGEEEDGKEMRWKGSGRREEGEARRRGARSISNHWMVQWETYMCSLHGTRSA